MAWAENLPNNARTLVAAPVKVWPAVPARLADAQAASLHRARCNAAVRMGKHTESMEHELVA
jgi:hypothetical protein